MWCVAEIDKAAGSRNRALFERLLVEQKNAVALEQESTAVWDDALAAAKNRDTTWLEANIGVWNLDYAGHETSVIFDGGATPFFIAEHGRLVSDPDDVRDALAVGSQLVRELRDIAAADSTYHLSTVSSTIPRLTDFSSIGGRPAVVSAMLVVTDSGELTQARGSEPVLVSFSDLETRLEKSLIAQSIVHDGFFADQPDPGQLYSTVPITDRFGGAVSTFNWLAYKPGSQLLDLVRPAALLVFFLAAAGSMLLARHLHKALKDLGHRRDEAVQLARTDALTGLLNRLGFDGELALTLQRAGSRASVVIFDLDHFKNVNDVHGHAVGDDVLRMIARRLRGILAPGQVAARLGGDEFAVLVDLSTDAAAAESLADKIRAAMRAPIIVGNIEFSVMLSIGLSGPSELGERNEELLRRADFALYQAKRGGRNRVEIYEANLSLLLKRNDLVARELKTALTSGDGPLVAFQPLFSRSGDLWGAEALLRWTHPSLGEIAPGDLVALAEATGLIDSLGMHVLSRVCEVAARHPAMIFAVNVSPLQLRSRDFAERVSDIVLSAGLKAGAIELEITEGALIETRPEVRNNLSALRAAGHRVALDDFGTGYSSLGVLRHMTVDRIKIDRSFVADIPSDPQAIAVARSIVELAHTLGASVTAEGVESEAQRRALADMKCDVFQGFLLARPMQSDEFDQLVAARQSVASVAGADR